MINDKEITPKVNKKGNCRHELQNECESVKKVLKKEHGLNQILGRSKVIQEVHEKIEQVSSCDVNVLISGESGTGKELVARAIHYLSNRAGNPFIPVNCGAIPENIFENELFGHVKGAFTDACRNQTGLIQEAEGGVFFLDEIGSVSPYVQVKLLRLLQDKEYKPLGDSRHCKANVRIIAATNKDLLSLVNKGLFREDLFYRLNIVHIKVPSLRERKEDIPILVAHFVDKYSREYNKPAKTASADLIRCFTFYSWPGNIRELENKIQQLIVMSKISVIDAKSIQLTASEPTSQEPELECLREAKEKVIYTFERAYLSQLLTESRGNVASAAKRAGKSRTALWNLLKKRKISPGHFRAKNS